MSNGALRYQRFKLSEKSKENMVFGICLICMFLFIYTAYSKMMDHARFFKGLYRISVLSNIAIYLSWFVPISEVIVSILLIIPKTFKWGLYAFVSLMVIFTTYIISMLLWSKKLPCHCGGAIEKLTWGQHIWFNLVFIAIAIYALHLIKNNLKFKT